MDWMITVPKTIDWGAYLKELATVADGSSEMNYRVQYFPRGMTVGDRIFVLWDGRVRGWMALTNMKKKDSFVCPVTKRAWDSGNYLIRSGPFHHVSGPAMTGFRGVRKYKYEGE